ncbi:MAG: hypothetical protein V4614_10760 [Pseudomonadota bacterium]
MRMPIAKVASLLVLAAMAGCADKGWHAEAPLYRCEAGVEFRASFIDNTVVVDGSGGYDVLYRDAGGVGEQAFYRNPRMRAEFGLGASGREAILRYPLLPLVVRCVRE